MVGEADRSPGFRGRSDGLACAFRPEPENPRARWMCGSATLTMVASSTTISCAMAMTNRARPPASGSPPGAVGPATAAAFVVIDRVSGIDAPLLSLTLSMILVAVA